MVTYDGGAHVAVDDARSLFVETPGRAVVETTDPAGVEARFDGLAPVRRLGTATDIGVLRVEAGDDAVAYDAEELAERRAVLDRELE
jgi:phosphoribosylformylglycinamidine synthase